MKLAFKKKYFKSVIALLVATQLTACVGLLLAGAAGGSIVGSDRRNTQTQIDDKQVEAKVGTLLYEKYAHTHVNASSYGGIVLLTGEVPDAATGKAIEAQTLKLTLVKGVLNELGVGAMSGVGERSADVAMTAKVKAALYDDKYTHGNAFRVTTERGTVYLQGTVTKLEGERAAALAARISGVRQVVKALDYLSDEQMTQLPK